jgi:hypothetical protein
MIRPWWSDGPAAAPTLTMDRISMVALRRGGGRCVGQVARRRTAGSVTIDPAALCGAHWILTSMQEHSFTERESRRRGEDRPIRSVPGDLFSDLAGGDLQQDVAMR